MQTSLWVKLLLSETAISGFMNADGGRQINIAKSKDIESSLSWPPDGKQILFVRAKSSGFTSNLWLMDANGSSQNN